MAFEKAKRLVTQRIALQNRITNDAGSILILTNLSLNVISLVITLLTIAATYRMWKQLRDLKSRMRAHESFEESKVEQDAGEEE